MSASLPPGKAAANTGHHNPPGPGRGSRGTPPAHPAMPRGEVHHATNPPGTSWRQHKPSDLTITGSPACRRQGSCIRASGPARSHSVVGALLADARIAADRYVQRLLCARPLLRAELTFGFADRQSWPAMEQATTGGDLPAGIGRQQGRYPAARCSSAAAMLGRPSAAETVQVTNFVGPMTGLSEVITPTCGAVRMNSRSAASSFQTDSVQ